MADAPWVRTQKLPHKKNEFHVLPTNDKNEHVLVNCPCEPAFDVEESNGKIIAVAVVHRAWDDRPGPLEN